MRLSTNQIFNNSVDSILDSQERLIKAQDRITNQTRLLTPSDDPAATAQVMRLNEKIELTSQYEANGTILENKLQTEEVALNALKVSIDRVKVLVIQAGSGSLSDADRTGISFEVATIQEEVFDLMNTKDANGDFIFAGFQSKIQPFVLNQNTNVYDYQGDEGELKLQVSSSVALASNDNGKKLFEDADTRLRVGNLTGIANSSATVGSQALFDSFHQANYDPSTPANNTYNVTYSAPSNYTITNAGTGATAATGTYSLNEGVSFNGLNIKPGGTPPAVGTVGFTLSEPGKKNLLTTLNDLVGALSTPGGFTPALNESLKDALTQVNNSKDQIHMVQSSLGGRLNVVDRVLKSNIEINHANQKTRADIAEIDYSEAVTDLMKEESALEAAQATFGRVSRLSLFDYIS